jgi:short-subunit dehydrogenase
MADFSGTTTFITGASSGIGRSLALEIARLGGSVILAARRHDRLETLASAIEALDGRALPVACDVTRDGDCDNAVDSALKQFGRIDYVVANAGFGVAGRFETLSLDDYRRQFETNIFGAIRTIQATKSSLIESKGCLALMGSVNGYIALPRLSAYVMSKYAIHGLADSLRHELRGYGVAVTLIVPGFIDTEIRKVDRYGVYHAEMKDRIPLWLRMPSDRAARAIAQALVNRKREKIITAHASVSIHLQRYLPGLVNLVINRSGTRKGRD